jgi:hypothetical protein
MTVHRKFKMTKLRALIKDVQALIDESDATAYDDKASEREDPIPAPAQDSAIRTDAQYARDSVSLSDAIVDGLARFHNGTAILPTMQQSARDGGKTPS